MRLIIGFKVRLRFSLFFFLPSAVVLSLEFVAMNNFYKELGTKNHNSNL